MTTGLAIAALVLLVLAVPAFWPAYLSRLSSADAYTHAHGPDRDASRMDADAFAREGWGSTCR